MAIKQLDAAIPRATPPAPGIWDLDPSHTTLEFVARHVFTKVRGRFPVFTGSITIAEDPRQSFAEATIETAGVQTSEDRRDGHLRSDDFFAVESWPHITFTSTSIEPVNENRFKVRGDLTVKDVTRQVTLDAEFLGWTVDAFGNERAGFSASTRINREDFGLTWNMALEAGGWLVGKDVDLDLQIAAVRRAAA
jgi:polyisoprenoid-binding protein YceI